MTRVHAIAMLSARAELLRSMGATALYLFGSVARDEPDAHDIDVFIDYDPTSRFSLLDLAGIKMLLEEELSAPVDLTTRDSLHPLLRAEIEQGAVRVF